jgi:hypothetical protein
MADKTLLSRVPGAFCVAGSVAVGTPRDAKSIIAPLSGVTCGLYEGIREFGRTADPFFKSLATLV